MSNIKKKTFPKIKKKLKWFLTDESGKITKKDALGLSVWAVLLSGIEDVAGHGNDDTWLHYNAYGVNVQCSANAVTVNHASWTVNWHYSSTPWYTWWEATSSWHASHWSHCSWCSTCSNW